MKKTTNLLISSVVMIAFLLTFSSCSEDEKKKKTAKVSFDINSQTVSEDEEFIFVPFDVEDGPIDVDAELSFEVTGTATLVEDYVYDGWDEDGVYFILVNDNTFESDETFTVSITEGEKVNIGSPSAHTVTIENDDVDTGPNLKIDLTWDAGSGTPGNVDMDLILWKYDPIGDVFNDIDGSAEFGTVFESLTLLATEEDATYGLTYQYYEGSSDNLEFTVTFVTTDGSIEGTENELVFSETYTLDNVNSTSTVFIEQIFDKDGTDYNNFSAIEVPTNGSRLKSFKIPSLKSIQNTTSKKITATKTKK